MGKNKKRKRSKGRKDPPPTSVQAVATATTNNTRAPPLSLSPGTTSFHKSGRIMNLPCAFPSHLPRPATGFLRNEAPFQASFAAALDTAYEGFVVDDNVSSTTDDIGTSSIETTLQTELRDCFRADVTQPFGLGTKCAKTYVTRCLVGEFGTTYKVCGCAASSVLRCPRCPCRYFLFPR